MQETEAEVGVQIPYESEKLNMREECQSTKGREEQYNSNTIRNVID